MQALWWVLLGISVVVFLFSAGYAVPKAFFKPGYHIPASFDRGLKNYAEPDGRSIVYEPEPAFRKYVSQYILSERGGQKVLLAKPDEMLSHIDYDVALFNRRNRVFKVLNIREEIVRPGYTQITELPPETAYASLTVNSADGRAVERPVQKKRKRRFAGFSAVVGLLTVLEIFFIKLCLGMLFGDVFAESFMVDDAAGFLITLGVGAVAASVHCAAAAVYYRRKNKRNAGGVPKD